MIDGKFVPIDTINKNSNEYDKFKACNNCRFDKKCDDEVLQAIIKMFEGITKSKLVDTHIESKKKLQLKVIK